MNADLLAQARHYEKTYGSRIAPEERPLFHVTPTVGWLNDPNGLSYYQGKYHLFYQYNPYNTHWASMHWGHLVSEDLIRWERLPAAMAPDKPYDNAGVFSGSALTLPDGRHLLMYTGVEEQKRDDGFIDSRQTQCIAFGDGLNYQKYERNPVITPEMLPEGSSTEDFRDPKIWWDEADRCFYAVMGSRNQYGKMWECPDFFPLDGADVLIVSPMEMLAEGLEFHNGNNAAYLTGRWDRHARTFERLELRALDYGLDFYAPQTLLTPDGRRVLIGWMQSPETGHSQPHDIKWFGQMTIPRELSVRGGRLLQRPVRELERYRGELVICRNVYVRERLCLPQVSGRCVDMTVRVRPAGGALYQKFTIKIAKDTEFYTAVTYDPGSSVLRFDRSHSGFRHNIVASRKALVDRKSVV